MKKLLVTMDIDYDKTIKEITFPYMVKYAEKIGADFKLITERKFLDCPVNIEKFQLYEISKDYDWTIFLDADAIIHPNCPDLTELFDKSNVIFNTWDFYPIRFKPNNYSRRDGRNLGACTWFTVFSDMTRHLWKPHKSPLNFIDQISLTFLEKNFGYDDKHLLDDYLVSRNIAKYGLKVKSIVHDIYDSYEYRNTTTKPYLIHYYAINLKEKIKLLKSHDYELKNLNFSKMMKISSDIKSKYV